MYWLSEIKKILQWTLVFLLLLLVSSSFNRPKVNDTFYQISTIDALLSGSYDGVIKFGKLKKYGDFGHGTFDKLNGELVVLDGNFFQVDHQGKVHKVQNQWTSPFANLVFFKSDKQINIDKVNDLGSLYSIIESKLLSKNYLYAIKIHGDFSKLKLRSVPKQDAPYKPLAEVITTQSIFNYENIQGTMVGFLIPDYIKGLNVPGYHFHFISDDKKFGGHVLDLNEVNNIKIEIDLLDKLDIKLPAHESFANSNLSKDRSRELEKVEKS